MKKTPEITRRQFVKGALAVSAGLAAARAENENSAAAHALNLASAVLLKNSGDTLPLAAEGGAVCVLSFAEKGPSSRTERELTAALAALGCRVVEDAEDADVVYLHVNPALSSTDHLGVIDLVEGLPVEARDNPLSQEKTGETILCTTVDGIGEIADIAARVHARGGKVVGAINIQSPWILTHLEPCCDALLAVFDTSAAAQAAVLTGGYAPTGRLPITLPSCNKVIAVEEREIDGTVYEICVSPNDVPGYDKDAYIDPAILSAAPGGSYAYCDAEGNYYRAGFGLTY